MLEAHQVVAGAKPQPRRSLRRLGAPNGAELTLFPTGHMGPRGIVCQC